MKGDGFIKNIKLIFIGTGYYNFNQASIEIYDLDNNLICSDYTYNGALNINLKSKCFYRVVAKTKQDIINKVFYVSKYCDTYYFIFNTAIIEDNTNEETVIFLLTDSNYADLKIGKGEIILWQR